MTGPVQLSTAELLTLHALLGEPECPGIDLSRLQQSVGAPEAAMEAGLDSLRRRGLATLRGTTLGLHAELALLGQTLFFPEVSTLRWDETEDGQDGFAALNLSSGVVLRWTWSPARWEGALSADLSAGLASLCHPLPPQRHLTASARLPRAAFATLRDLARRDANAAGREVYRVSGGETRSATALMNAFALTTRQHVFAVLRLHDEVVTGADSALVVVGDGVACRVTVAPDDAAILVCESIERDAAVAGLRRSIEALLGAPAR